MNAKTSSEIDGETHSIEHLTETIIDDRYHQKSWFGKFIQAITSGRLHQRHSLRAASGTHVLEKAGSQWQCLLAWLRSG